MIDDLLGVMGSLAMGTAEVVGLISPTPSREGNNTDLPLQDMTIVVTGTLERFKRTEIEEVIERHGGRTSSSVSSKTSFVLVGAEAGSKLAKAQKLGVRIVNEQEFLVMIGLK